MERATDPAVQTTPMSLREQLQGSIVELGLGAALEQGLLEALHAEVKRNPVMARVDQVLVNEDRVFAVYRPFGEQPPVHHVNVPLRGVQQTSATEPVVGADGYLTDQAVTRHEVPGLGRSSMGEPVALVMHRTESATAASALKSFASGRDGVQYGTHFLIDKDGTIYQTASLGQKTLHVGKIKSRCVEEGTCSEEESRWRKSAASIRRRPTIMKKPSSTRSAIPSMKTVSESRWWRDMSMAVGRPLPRPRPSQSTVWLEFFNSSTDWENRTSMRTMSFHTRPSGRGLACISLLLLSTMSGCSKGDPRAEQERMDLPQVLSIQGARLADEPAAGGVQLPRACSEWSWMPMRPAGSSRLPPSTRRCRRKGSISCPAASKAWCRPMASVGISVSMPPELRCGKVAMSPAISAAARRPAHRWYC